MREAWTHVLITSFQAVVGRLGLMAPRLLAMLTLILVGWIVAVIARRLAVRVLLAAGLDAYCRRWGLTAAFARAGIRQPPTVLMGDLVYSTLPPVALLIGIEALEMPATAELVALVLRFLPNLIVAILVMVTGWVLANFLAQATLIRATNSQVAGAPLIGGGCAVVGLSV